MTGSQAASSSQNSMTGGCGSGESVLTTGGTEGIPRSDFTCVGELQVLTWFSPLPLVYWMEIVCKRLPEMATLAMSLDVKTTLKRTGSCPSTIS